MELIGDARIGGTGRWDIGQTSDGVNTGRPVVTGVDYTLTVGGKQVVMRDADVNPKSVVVADGATLGLENGTKEALSEGLHLQQGTLQFWWHHNAFTSGIFVDGADTCLRSGRGDLTVSGPVHVAEGAALKLETWDDAVLRFKGGIFGSGTLNAVWGVTYFASDVEQDKLDVTSNGYAIYGDMTAEGNDKKWPKSVRLESGNLGFAPSTNAVYSGYVISGSGNFVPSFQWSSDAIPVTTVENTTIEGDDINLALGLTLKDFGGGHRTGDAVLGTGFVAESLKGVILGCLGSAPADATLTLGADSRITMKPDAEILLGQWSGEANNLHRLVVDGGTLDAAQAKPVRVGYDARAAEFLVKDGAAKLSGVATRNNRAHNMTPITGDNKSHTGYSYEVFGMSGGTVELGGDFTTERIYPYLPQIWLGGGTLKSMKDWSTDYYQYATFETWGDSRDETKKEFTLDTNGHTVNFRSALQGNANVKITGSGSFIADDNVQGGL